MIKCQDPSRSIIVDEDDYINRNNNGANSNENDNVNDNADMNAKIDANANAHATPKRRKRLVNKKSKGRITKSALKGKPRFKVGNQLVYQTDRSMSAIFNIFMQLIV